jgi:transposase
MPGDCGRFLIHSEISFLRISVGCEANHFSASLAVAISCRAASMAASASLEGNAGCVLRLYRHGTLSLYAALETHSGEILGKTAPRHTSAEFVDFLAPVGASQPPGREIHAITDNLATHKTRSSSTSSRRVIPQVHIHFTPTYSSWLNQVEIWFAKIQRQVIARVFFSSVDDLPRNILR